mmetsp:Transcript_18411/g.43208  ORF Transcript_18411/g.43208 Transcript_18411/m.43208 type:complete len:209 (-) Transcript_18411:868-1494(-)
MPQGHSWPHSCRLQLQSLGGGRFSSIQSRFIFCVFPSKNRGYLSHARMRRYLFFSSIPSRSSSCSLLSNWMTKKLPSSDSSAIMPSSGFLLFCGTSVPPSGPGCAVRTQHFVHTRSPLCRFTEAAFSSSSRRLLPAGPSLSPRPRLPVRFGPLGRKRAPRRSSEPEMIPRRSSWSSGRKSSKPSKSSVDSMTRVFFLDRVKTLNMHRA